MCEASNKSNHQIQNPLLLVTLTPICDILVPGSAYHRKLMTFWCQNWSDLIDWAELLNLRLHHIVTVPFYKNGQHGTPESH
jgi:hypothetical protein